VAARMPTTGAGASGSTAACGKDQKGSAGMANANLIRTGSPQPPPLRRQLQTMGAEAEAEASKQTVNRSYSASLIHLFYTLHTLLLEAMVIGAHAKSVDITLKFSKQIVTSHMILHLRARFCIFISSARHLFEFEPSFRTFLVWWLYPHGMGYSTTEGKLLFCIEFELPVQWRSQVYIIRARRVSVLHFGVSTSACQTTCQL
jgi:hypothetical protein